MKQDTIELMTEAELAKRMKVCRRHLYNWRKAGHIPYLKIGKAVRFRVCDVEEALEKLTTRNA